MSRPSVGSSNTSNFASMAMTRARCSWVTMPFDNSLIWGKAENRVERGRLACAVGPDNSEDAALFDTQIDAVQRDGCAERLTEPTCFYACHGLSGPPLF